MKVRKKLILSCWGLLLHSFRTVIVQMMGTGANIEYIRPPCFQHAYSTLTSVCDISAVKRSFVKVFVDGASGSGKTRLGWELFKEVQRKAKDLGLKHVSYGLVDAGGPPLSDPQATQYSADQAAAAVAQSLVRSYGVECTQVVLGRSLSLRQVAEAMMPAGSDDGKLYHSVLVLHVDEFQKALRPVMTLLSFIREYNGEKPRVLILPVCTGLWVDADVADEPSGEWVVLRLNYLQDVDGAWMLVRHAAADATTEKRVLELLAMQWQVPLLHYLVEDTLGWPMACVQLGVELASYLAGLADCLAERLTSSILQPVEERVFQVLQTYYHQTVQSAMGGLSMAGLRKLAAMAISPFQARGWAA
jgi:hypothetical protein